MKIYFVLPKAFYFSNEEILWFLYLILFMSWITLIGIPVLSHHYIFVMNESHLVTVGNQFDMFLNLVFKLLLRIFASIFIRGNIFAFVVTYLSGFGIYIILFSLNNLNVFLSPPSME